MIFQILFKHTFETDFKKGAKEFYDKKNEK